MRRTQPLTAIPLDPEEGNPLWHRLDSLAAGVATLFSRLGLVLALISLVPLTTGRVVVSGWIVTGSVFAIAGAAAGMRLWCEARCGLLWVPTDTVEPLQDLMVSLKAVLDVVETLPVDEATEAVDQVRAALSAGRSAAEAVRASRGRGDEKGAEKASTALAAAVTAAEQAWLRCAELVWDLDDI